MGIKRPAFLGRKLKPVIDDKGEATATLGLVGLDILVIVLGLVVYNVFVQATGIPVSAAASPVQTKYTGLDLQDVLFTEDVTFTCPARSKLHCFLLCSAFPSCLTFTYLCMRGTSEGSCRGHSTVMNVTRSWVATACSRTYVDQSTAVYPASTPPAGISTTTTTPDAPAVISTTTTTPVAPAGIFTTTTTPDAPAGISTITTNTTIMPPLQSPPFACYDCDSGSSLPGSWHNDNCPENGGNIQAWYQSNCETFCCSYVGSSPAGTVFRGCSDRLYLGERQPAEGCFEDPANNRYVCLCAGDLCNSNDLLERSQSYTNQFVGK